MNPFSMNFMAEFAELLTTALIHFVWQGAVLTLILLITVKLLDVRTARLRYLLSVGTLLVMGMAPVVTAMLHHYGNSNPRHSSVEVPRQSNPVIAEHTAVNTDNTTGRVVFDVQKGSATHWNPSIDACVLMIWLAGVLILSTRLAIGFGVTLWIRASVKPLSDEFEQRLRILGERLSVDTRQRVFACVRVGQAVAVGFIRPIVLIPASWLTQLAPQTIEAIIAHELAHIRRWDLWVNLVQRIIETLLFYHPAVWWLSSRIRLEREMCCDEIAAECFDRVMYARSLETVVRISQGNLLMATSINGGKKMNLLNRIRYLLGVAPADAAGNWWAVGCVTMILPFAAAVAFSLSTVGTLSVASGDNTTAIEKFVAMRVHAKTVTVTQQYVCQIHSHRHINIRASERGHIEAVAVTKGQAVQEGDLILKVVPIHYQAKRDVALADAMLAQLESKQLKHDIENRAFSKNQVAHLEAKLAKSQAEENLATAQLNFTNIQAPFDGVVDSLRLQQGNMVEEGEVLATLSDNSRLSVYFNVSEARYLEFMKDLSQQKDDLQFELILANGNKFGHLGKFGAIEADFKNETGTIRFRADFPNPERRLRHGQSGTVLISRMLKDAIVVPQRATFEIFNKRYVYVIDQNDVAHRREIVIQNELEDLFVIKQGLGVDDRILIEGIRQVHDGEKVQCVDREPKRE